MSSQGAAILGTPSYNRFAADPSAGLPITIGYAFDAESIRDASDWIAYKKQTLISKESKTKLKASFPEISYSNSYRLDYLLGRFKNPSQTGCNSCSSGVPLFNQRASDDSPPS